MWRGHNRLGPEGRQWCKLVRGDARALSGPGVFSSEPAASSALGLRLGARVGVLYCLNRPLTIVMMIITACKHLFPSRGALQGLYISNWRGPFSEGLPGMMPA
jgi:hypothetical protein